MKKPNTLPFKGRSLAVLLLILSLCKVGLAATFPVSTTSDSGPNSLRQAILNANANVTASAGNPHIIDASGLTGTITLGSALPSLDNHILIKGPSNGTLVIDGATLYRIFRITAGNTVTFTNVTINNGRSNEKTYSTHAAGGAGINNFGNLTLINCIIQNCKATPNASDGTLDGLRRATSRPTELP